MISEGPQNQQDERARRLNEAQAIALGKAPSAHVPPFTASGAPHTNESPSASNLSFFNQNEFEQPAPLTTPDITAAPERTKSDFGAIYLQKEGRKGPFKYYPDESNPNLSLSVDTFPLQLFKDLNTNKVVLKVMQPMGLNDSRLMGFNYVFEKYESLGSKGVAVYQAQNLQPTDTLVNVLNKYSAS